MEHSGAASWESEQSPLSPEEQARVDAAWSREIEARVRAYRAGQMRTCSVEEDLAESAALLAELGIDSDDPDEPDDSETPPRLI
ncbi:MAG TPA: addiction module protein [Longimicrobium sp.]|jgi:hypothetical protein|uniref:addiction module protein n=1 Tax=Longimicrobium sp. TaxID=2029185 RepID=UPI002EDAEFEE